MTEYPEGVIRNNAPPYAPISPRPVDQEDWRMFSDQETADRGYGMIDSLCDNCSMVDAETLGAMYAQFVYLPGSPVHCRVVNGTTRDDDGPMKICEYPSDIVDRDSVPMPYIDHYTAGQPHTLKVMRLTPALGQLYWDAA
jgi:hypothetical protein